jgi:hypothetical protein
LDLNLSVLQSLTARFQSFLKFSQPDPIELLLKDCFTQIRECNRVSSALKFPNCSPLSLNLPHSFNLSV